MTTPPSLTIDAVVETWPIAGAFVIARGAKREATVVVARVSDGTITGRGECVPYARYGETVAGVRDAILGLRGTLRDRAGLARQMPAGAARNALDCALWDYEAKRSGTSAAQLAGLAPLRPVTTAYTISLDTADAMAASAAAAARTMPLLKLKLGGAGDAARLRQVRAACPQARLIADANEAWTPELLPSLMAVAAETGVELIEQPLPAGADAALAGSRAVPVCADEFAPRPSRPRCPRRALRRGQHQARQGRRPHRGAGARGRGGRCAASRSWWAAWCRPRSPWRRRCSSPRAPTGSTSTDRCCWRATARRPCATRAPSCTRPSLGSGAAHE